MPAAAAAAKGGEAAVGGDGEGRDQEEEGEEGGDVLPIVRTRWSVALKNEWLAKQRIGRNLPAYAPPSTRTGAEPFLWFLD